MILHGYWRSGTSYRVRIALHLRGIAYERAPGNLLAGDQRGEARRALHPRGPVPALEAGVAATLARALPAVAAAHPDRQPDARA